METKTIVWLAFLYLVGVITWMTYLMATQKCSLSVSEAYIAAGVAGGVVYLRGWSIISSGWG